MQPTVALLTGDDRPLRLSGAGRSALRAAIAGVLVAVAAAAKVFLWPLLVWLLVTRRLRGLSAAFATLGATLGLWAALDLHGLREYPKTLLALDQVERWKSYSPESLALSAGAPAGALHLILLALALAGVAAIVAVRRDDRTALAASIAVALFATPILWMHYLILLVVPRALASPVLAPVWALPVLPWAAGGPESNGAVWRIVIVLVVVAATSWLALRRTLRFRSA